MLRTVLAVCCLAAVSLIADAADAAFKPRLDQVSVNGELFYKAGEKLDQPRKLEVTLPVKVEYVFTNVGEKNADKPLAVCVHFPRDGKLAAGGDFKPSPATTDWAPGKQMRFVQRAYLEKQKGSELAVFIGLYDAAGKGGRLRLENPGLGKDLRLPLGTLKVK